MRLRQSCSFRHVCVKLSGKSLRSGNSGNPLFETISSDLLPLNWTSWLLFVRYYAIKLHATSSNPYTFNKQWIGILQKELIEEFSFFGFSVKRCNRMLLTIQFNILRDKMYLRQGYKAISVIMYLHLWRFLKRCLNFNKVLLWNVRSR